MVSSLMTPNLIVKYPPYLKNASAQSTKITPAANENAESLFSLALAKRKIAVLKIKFMIRNLSPNEAKNR